MILGMELTKAILLVEQFLKKIDEEYGGVVFDEAVIALYSINRFELRHYIRGPRPSLNSQLLTRHARTLLAEIGEGAAFPLDEWDPNAPGLDFDVSIPAGNNVFVLLNNTNKSLRQIQNDGDWQAASNAIASLIAKFAVDDISVG